MAAGFLVASACAVFIAPEARGDCVHPGQSSETQLDDVFDLLFHRFDGEFPETIPAFPGGPQPCRPGSSCSRGPEAPLAPAPVGVAPSMDRWGCLLSLADAQDPAGSFLRGGEPPVRPITGGDAPFHPPRPA